MRLLIPIFSLWAIAYAKPEMYKEKEDFQYSRSSSDEGSKSGYYGAQRGNMGGNYERAHNMDTLAQHQMSNLVRQVDVDLGEGANTRTGSVFTSGNSRGIYGSGNYDLSNLKGRRFEEGMSYGNSQSQSSFLAQNSGYSGNLYSADNNARYTTNQLRALGLTSQYGHIANQQAGGQYGGASNYEYGNQDASNYRYYTHGGSQAHSVYDQSNSNLYSVSNNDESSKSKIITTPVRVYLRPGTRIAIPVSAQTYDASQSALVRDQNTVNTDAELLSNSGQQTNVIKPTSNAKHYESSYSYHKEWEKHDTQPITVTPTENPFPQNSELYEDSQLSQSVGKQFKSVVDSAHTQTSNINSAYGSKVNAGYNSAHSANTKSLAGSHLQYQAQLQNSGSNVASNAHVFDSHTSGLSTNLNSLVEDINTRPKSYQSSYSYHKSWERHGDPYVITPVGGNLNALTSQRLVIPPADQNLYYGNQYGQTCDLQCHLRKKRSYHIVQHHPQPYEENFNPQYLNNWSNDLTQQQSEHQTSDYLGQQTQNDLDNLENLGQEIQNQLNNVDFGQQTQTKWDNLDSLNQHFESGVEDLSQQSQNQIDHLEHLKNLEQETQNIWNHLETLNQQYQSNVEDVSQQSQSKLDNLGSLEQETQNIMNNLAILNQQSQSNIDDVGQQSQSQLDNLQNLEQEAQNILNNLANLNQQPQNNIDDVGQQSQSQLDNLESLEQETQNIMNNLAILNQQPQSNIDDVGQQSQSQLDNFESLGQQTQKIGTNMDNQHAQSDIETVGEKSRNPLDNLGQQTQSIWNNLETLNQKPQSDIENLGQETQNIWNNLETLNQQPQSHIEDVDQQSQNQLDNLEGLGQQTQNIWKNLDSLNQHPQGNIETVDQKNPSQLDNLEDLGQQTQNTWNNLESLEQKPQSHIENLGQETQNTWNNLESLNQHPHNVIKEIDQKNQNPLDNIENFGQETQQQNEQLTPQLDSNHQQSFNTWNIIDDQQSRNQDDQMKTQKDEHLDSQNQSRNNLDQSNLFQQQGSNVWNKINNVDLTQHNMESYNGNSNHQQYYGSNKENTDTWENTFQLYNQNQRTNEKKPTSSTEKNLWDIIDKAVNEYDKETDINHKQFVTYQDWKEQQSVHTNYYHNSHHFYQHNGFEQNKETSTEKTTVPTTESKKYLLTTEKVKTTEKPKTSITTVEIMSPTEFGRGDIGADEILLGPIEANNQMNDKKAEETQNNFNSKKTKDEIDSLILGNINENQYNKKFNQEETDASVIGLMQQLESINIPKDNYNSHNNLNDQTSPKQYRVPSYNKPLTIEKEPTYEDLQQSEVQIPDNFEQQNSNPKWFELEQQISHTQDIKDFGEEKQQPISVNMQKEQNDFDKHLGNEQEKIQIHHFNDYHNKHSLNEEKSDNVNNNNLQSNPKKEEIVEQPIEPTEKPGFWKSVWNKTVSAKDKVVSWFKN